MPEIRPLAEVTRKLVLLDIDERDQHTVALRWNVRELPTAEELGRVALEAWQIACKHGVKYEDALQASGQAILDAIRRKP